jgi:hypothetical protein
MISNHVTADFGGDGWGWELGWGKYGVWWYATGYVPACAHCSTQVLGEWVGVHPFVLACEH